MTHATTVRDLLCAAEQQLISSNTARLDAEVLLASVMNTNREIFYAHPENEVPIELITDYQSLISKRAHIYPVAYLTGSKEFWSNELIVNQYTLIPRPETETLVESAFRLIPSGANMHILDLGTGSGAIAIAIAKERPDCQIMSTDISIEAIAVANANVTQHQLSNIEFRQSDWFSNLADSCFDLILCNPPYVDSTDEGFIDGEIRYEPRLALDGGYQGMQSINTIVPAATQHLKPNGYFIIEHGNNQGENVRRLFSANRYVNAETIKDFSGFDRVSFACYP